MIRKLFGESIWNLLEIESTTIRIVLKIKPCVFILCPLGMFSNAQAQKQTHSLQHHSSEIIPHKQIEIENYELIPETFPNHNGIDTKTTQSTNHVKPRHPEVLQIDIRCENDSETIEIDLKSNQLLMFGPSSSKCVSSIRIWTYFCCSISRFHVIYSQIRHRLLICLETKLELRSKLIRNHLQCASELPQDRHENDSICKPFQTQRWKQTNHSKSTWPLARHLWVSSSTRHRLEDRQENE